ncbi:Ig-like domain-containing protein [Cohnella rhizosphaerae]|uniref:Ig-like domain-containing protein n=1 Tax=Cohnella rhizosphaerae TaxID=1457232 RepID=A0A9X4KRV9_9BACL|nr:Ig-like domain-containing protein [Cohnella rhizosphaerae]MDG0809989.1 Ig-like domain-containing protein [Cohnella rhizosphaerae]
MLDITFDRASGAYAGTHKVNGQPIDYASFKLFDTPWLQQERGSTTFTATESNERLTYDFGSWTITASDPTVQVPVSGVALGASTLTVGAGKTAALTAVVSPANASNKNVLWSSSAPSVATVGASGTVTGVAPGSAVITATTEDGAFTATAAVTVTAEPLFQDTFAGGPWQLGPVRQHGLGDSGHRAGGRAEGHDDVDRSPTGRDQDVRAALQCDELHDDLRRRVRSVPHAFPVFLEHELLLHGV